MLLFRTTQGQSPVLTLLADAMQGRHAENESVLLDMLDRDGWPRISDVGAEAAYAAGNVLNHTDLSTRLAYMHHLRAACEAGEADWSDYAHVYDRTELESGRPQLFGTQMEMDEGSGRYVARELADPEGVDALRLERGMEPLAAQLERFNSSMSRDFGPGG